MKLVEMTPGRLREATTQNLPLLIPCGVVEYHGPHLPIGTDWLMVSELLGEVERRVPEECVLAPGFPLGPTGSWAGSPTDGELDLPAEGFFQYVRAVIAGYLEMGFRRILICQHHQGPNGVQVLCLKRAAAELALEAGKREGGGPGWGAVPKDRSPAVFGRVRVAHPGSFLRADSHSLDFSHGGYGETSYVLGCRPDLVHLGSLDGIKNSPPWLDDAPSASGEAGGLFFQACVEGWIGAVRAGK